MPCNSDHMEPSGYEIEHSKIQCCFDDLNGLPIEAGWWKGYHPKAYCKRIDKASMDELTASLCDLLNAHSDISSLSLETQTWWRDHQKADIKRIAKEQEQAKTDEIKKSALDKLSDKEKKALGLE